MVKNAKHIFEFIFILAVLSLCCHMWASSGCGQWGYSPAVVLGASFCSGFSCYRAQSLGDMGFSSCGSCSQSLWYMGLVVHSMWDLSRPGIKPLCPAVASGCLTTGPPGKPHKTINIWKFGLPWWSVVRFSSVQSLSCVRIFATPWIAAHQASLSITNSQSLLKPMSIELVMPSNDFILCRPLLLLPLIPPSIQDWSPLGWTGWISLQSKGLSRVFSNTTVQKHQFFGA